ncbi:choice-of-anchor D domain-containing protein [Calothrix sp. UHCC 0171]|uniref:choice-of-anchor D domain-containing protein n=1 Tax=Calothrix sp. UHCC 0171 TaxID=3110245 RepID=UPI002B2050DB|nr:choice-of-anchor D domain-containing protein [Calothrix sp. UHCC 0171]MEA5571354.1 choice-of-anchor D domain-containing protein [Calothrix sp. UHCC 0171]
MTQQQIVELAKQGDINAIEALINELLKPQGITAKVGLKDSCLYVALVAVKVPEKKALVRIICQQIVQWHVESLNYAKIYAAQWGNNLPVWQQVVHLYKVRPKKVINKSVQLTTLTIGDKALSKNSKYNHCQSSESLGNSSEIVGNYLTLGKLSIQINSNLGSILSIATQKHQIQSRPSHPPQELLSSPTFPYLIGRLKEIKSAIHALNCSDISPESKKSIEFYGDTGLGKSALLRYLNSFIQGKRVFTDGTIFLNSHYQTVSDILQSLFDILYASDITYKPTDLEISQAVNGKKILIILDDKNLTAAEIKQLQTTLPNCPLVLASTSKRLDETDFTNPLSGLTTRDALTFVTQELEVNPDDFQAIEALANLLGGNPWLLRLAVTSINQEIYTLGELVLKLQPPATNHVLIAGILAAIPKSDREILLILAAMNGVPLLATQVEALSGVSTTAIILQNLAKWHLVTIEQERYYINDILIRVLEKDNNLTAWRELIRNYFTNWAEKYQSLPSLLHSETDIFIEILTWGVKAENWQQVLRLVQAIESSLALGKQWGLWEKVLKLGLQAALTVNDKPAEAFMLHQLGSRALCLEDMAAARNYLTHALKIRKSLENENAANITQQNLNLISVILSKLDADTTKLTLNSIANNSISANTKIQLSAVTLISLFCVGCTGFMAWLVLLRPKLLPIAQTNTPNLPANSDETDLTQIIFTHSKLNFGRQAVNTESQRQTVTIANQSAMSVQIGNIQKDGEQGDFEVSNSCVTTISPNQTCNISVAFVPIDTGKHSASLAVSDRNGKILKTLLIEGFATTAQLTPDNLVPAPPQVKQEPLPLPQPKLIPPSPLLKSPKRIIPQFPVAAPIPESSESPAIPTESPQPGVTESPQPEATDTTLPTPTEEIPAVIEAPTTP